MVTSVEINGKTAPLTSPEEVVLTYTELPPNANIMITTEGGWTGDSDTTDHEYPAFPSLVPTKKEVTQLPGELSDSLKQPFAILEEMKIALEIDQNAEYERAFVNAAIKAFQDCRVRQTMDPGSGYYRVIKEERKQGIITDV